MLPIDCCYHLHVDMIAQASQNYNPVYIDGTGPSSPRVSKTRSHKRIIVCCDGTWQDGIIAEQRWKYTNILRLARAINHADERAQPPIHQVVFYQSGIGTENLYDEVVNGVTGASLASKVEEAYAFIAHNYRPGDEIFLFGFSRGAYTARMVAMFIGAIGVLDRTDMDHFATIFVAYQKRGKSNDPDEVARLDEELAPWTGSEATGKRRLDGGDGAYTIKVLGVFDTVGSVGMPEELTLHNDKMKSLFGFPDRLLGNHVEKAYQALALNEHRADFDCAKFEQTEEGRSKGQQLKQCWFIGSHCDIGGGYEEHDLSDITLNWMISNIGDDLSFDYDYIVSLPRPTTVWGTQPPHDSRTGIFELSKEIQRKLPTATNDITYEFIHSSVVPQSNTVSDLQDILNQNPGLVAPLLPWEAQVKTHWEKKFAQMPQSKFQTEERAQEDASRDHRHQHGSVFHRAVDAMKHLKAGNHTEARDSDVHARDVQGWIGKVAAESSVGRLVEELLK
ncbi:hypothetical protein BC628DRAFT_1375260 [Trametes gibbosa]|nr:hypothetical protein BC628DRAFT_1375260 [Trametes gibbosa]